MNYFEVFALPRRLGLDADDLQRRFYELSRRHHPDFHQAAPPEAQARALEASALVNAAYRTLRDPIARMEYLLRLEEGRAAGDGADVKAAAPPALLAEMFEIQAALEEARSGGLDAAARATLAAQRARLLERSRDAERRLTGPLARAWDEGPAADRPRVLAACRETLATRAYLRTVIQDLSLALGEDEGSSVSNRRH
jgi:molecular chaperone HscB